MEMVKVDMEIEKNYKEAVDAIAALVEDIKAKKDYMIIATENLPLIAAALDGADQIGAGVEAAEEESAAYMVQQVWKAFKAKAE